MEENIYQNEAAPISKENSYSDLETRQTVFYEELKVEDHKGHIKSLSVIRKATCIGAFILLVLVIIQIVLGVFVGLNSNNIRDIGEIQRIQKSDEEVRRELINLINAQTNSSRQQTAFEKVDALRRELLDMMKRQTESLRQQIFRLQQLLNYFPYYSCYHVFLRSSYPLSGEYEINNGKGETYTVYCDFQQGHIYTYIAKTDTAININSLFNNYTAILIRHKLINGTQYEATYGQLSIYNHRNISIQYNSSINYSPIRNQEMSPYIYVGLLNSSEVSQGDINGYSVNGHDFNFTNCDGSPNTYFALLFNAANSNMSAGAANGPEFMYRWKTEAKVVTSDRNLDNKFFAQFELHFGGCGGYLTSDHLPDVEGVSFGFRFDMK